MEFVRIIPKQGYEDWPAKLGRMNQLHREAECQMVKGKFRRAALISVDPNNIDKLLEDFNKDGLILCPLAKIKSTSSYSYQRQSPEIGEPFVWFSCVTRDSKDAQIFKEADLKRDDKTIGQLLGYPNCCIEYFKKTFPINYDPIWLDLEGKISGYPEGNYLLRYFGAKIIPYFSCSPTCEATKKVGRVWLKVMQEINKDLASEIYDLLAGSITWNSYHGIAQVETPYFVGLVHSFPFLDRPRVIYWRGKKEKDGVSIQTETKTSSRIKGRK